MKFQRNVNLKKLNIHELNAVFYGDLKRHIDTNKAEQVSNIDSLIRDKKGLNIIFLT